MSIAVIALIGVVLLLALVWLVRANRRVDGKQAQQEGLHNRRIGDGLRRLHANKEKYGVMTEALLAQTEDDMLLEAVLSNLWAKMQPDLSDAVAVMAGQSPERRRIYALYAVTGSVKQDGFEKALRGPEGPFAAAALEALGVLGMSQSAALMAEALRGDTPDLYNEPYTETFVGEAGKERMTAYIRENSKAFCDLT